MIQIFSATTTKENWSTWSFPTRSHMRSSQKRQVDNRNHFSIYLYNRCLKKNLYQRPGNTFTCLRKKNKNIFLFLASHLHTNSIFPTKYAMCLVLLPVSCMSASFPQIKCFPKNKIWILREKKSLNN